MKINTVIWAILTSLWLIAITLTLPVNKLRIDSTNGRGSRLEIVREKRTGRGNGSDPIGKLRELSNRLELKKQRKYKKRVSPQQNQGLKSSTIQLQRMLYQELRRIQKQMKQIGRAAGPSGIGRAAGPSGIGRASGPFGFESAAGLTGFEGAAGLSGFEGAAGPSGLGRAVGPSGFEGAAGPSGLGDAMERAADAERQAALRDAEWQAAVGYVERQKALRDAQRQGALRYAQRQAALRDAEREAVPYRPISSNRPNENVIPLHPVQVPRGPIRPVSMQQLPMQQLPMKPLPMQPLPMQPFPMQLVPMQPMSMRPVPRRPVNPIYMRIDPRLHGTFHPGNLPQFPSSMTPWDLQLREGFGRNRTGLFDTK